MVLVSKYIAASIECEPAGIRRVDVPDMYPCTVYLMNDTIILTPRVWPFHMLLCELLHLHR